MKLNYQMLFQNSLLIKYLHSQIIKFELYLERILKMKEKKKI